MADQEIAPEDKPLDDVIHAEERQQVEETGNLSSPEDGPQPGEDPKATVVIYATDEELAEMGDL